MKRSRIATLLFISFIVFPCGVALSQTGTELKRYQVKSGIVEYSLSGAQKGTEIIYFDNWGLREARYTKAELSMFGMSQKENTLTLLDGGYTYTIDLDQRTGTKTATPFLKELAAQSRSKDLSDVGEKLAKDMGGVKVGTETVLGKTCDVWEFKNLGGRDRVWKGISLKAVGKMPGMDTTKIATKIADGVSVPADKFTIPADAKMTDAGDMKTMEGLKPRTKN